MDDLDKEMKMSFIEEARQLLEDAEQCFLDLESQKGDPEVIEKIFRLAHNMKGTSRAVGFGEVAEFTHELENMLLKIKKNEMTIDDETVNLLLECNDHLKVMVNALSMDLEARFDSRDLIAKIEIKLRGGSIVEATESNFEVPLANNDQFIEDPFAEPAPEAQLLESSEMASAVQLTIVPSPAHPAVEAGSAPTASHPELAPEVAPVKPAAPLSAVAAPSAAPPVAAPVAAAKATAATSGSDESIRVSLSRLETLSDFIGELVILQTVLNQHRSEIRSDLVQKTISQLGKISKEIQDISMSLRMIPLKQTFAKLQRIVRDTSKALDKSVELVLEGDQTEVDKTVLEHLSDPLVHIVRNAIDHGLETTEGRTEAGKSTTGKVVISAFHQGHNLVIEIRDDGKGIDPQRLLTKAIEKGVLPVGTQMSDKDAMNLIFKPGYSTKDQVSEISGRGVGLDVVKTNVERLSGQVQLESEVGKGSVFRVILPLTLAIVDAMIVTVNNERYAIPLANIQETVQPKTTDVHHVTGQGEILSLRGEALALFKLRSLLNLGLKVGADASARAVDKSIALIINHPKRQYAVLVDDIIRQQQIVIKKLGPEIRQQKGLSGTAILGDGKPALILDMNDLVGTVRSDAGQNPVMRGAA